jgi:hypothetical protein
MNDAVRKKLVIVVKRKRSQERPADNAELETVPQPAFEAKEWDLLDLKSHPQQATHFPPLPYEEARALSADIEANGLREPLEFLPDGTIISGHRRRTALLGAEAGKGKCRCAI